MYKNSSQKHEDRGRMYECIDIQLAIEKGQFKTLNDVLTAVTKRAEKIDNDLKQNTP